MRWQQQNASKYRELQQRQRALHKLERATHIKREKYILADSRKTDKKAGLANDLTKEFIAAEIANGCVYCGEAQLQMTLDRIDNTKGHLMNNVVPACIRCNILRRNMPYGAWLLVAKGMREAREAGLFSGWEIR